MDDDSDESREEEDTDDLEGSREDDSDESLAQETVDASSAGCAPLWSSPCSGSIRAVADKARSAESVESPPDARLLRERIRAAPGLEWTEDIKEGASVG